MRSWTQTGAASCSNRIRRVCKTAMVADRFCEVSRRIFPFIQRVFAERICRGKAATATLIAVEILRRPPVERLGSSEEARNASTMRRSPALCR